MMHTKRPHKKSRTGCQSCRDRRVKCDEVRPRCTSCHVRNSQCDYPPIRIKSTAVTLSSGNTPHSTSKDHPILQGGEQRQLKVIAVDQVPLSLPPPYPSTHTKLHDMRLLHHYCTVTIETLGVNIPLNTSAIRVWQKEVPQLAFEHEFLMDNLLALASAHMDQLDPQSANYELTALYHERAVRVFREAVTCFSKHNSLAVVIASTLQPPSSLVVNRKVNQNQLCSVDWLVVHTGVGAILEAAAWTDVLESCIAPIFQIQLPDPAPTLIPEILLLMLDSIPDDDREASHHHVLLESVVCLGELYGRIAQNGLDPATGIDIMRWPYAIPRKFRELAKEQLPRALVILAHFIVLFELLPQLWWVSDVAEHEIETISALLDPQWHPFLAFPKAAVRMKDQDQMLKLLSTQVSALDTIGSLPLKELFFQTSDEYVNPMDLDLHQSW